MPQKTLFEGWEVAAVTFQVALDVNKPGGRITVMFQDELGKPAGSRTVRWTKNRDCADLGLVARDVMNAFLWAPHMEMVQALDIAVRKHLPVVPSGQEDPNIL